MRGQKFSLMKPATRETRGCGKKSQKNKKTYWENWAVGKKRGSAQKNGKARLYLSRTNMVVWRAGRKE